MRQQRQWILLQAGSASATDSTKTDAAATEVSTEGKQLTVQIGSDPETIDPALNSAVDGGNMLLHSFECLSDD